MLIHVISYYIMVIIGYSMLFIFIHVCSNMCGYLCFFYGYSFQLGPTKFDNKFVQTPGVAGC